MTLSFDFSNRTVVVTGGAAGIGGALVAFFAARGAAVTSWDLAPPEVAAGGVCYRRLDVSDPEAVAQATQDVLERTGRYDVLVNNAGILRDRMLWKLEPADFDAVCAVHLRGTFLTTRAAVPTMRAARSGRIVNITSYTGLHGNLGQAAYAAAKAGVIGFTKTAAKELGQFGITVNAVSPNAETAMVASIPPERRQELLLQVPLGRFAHPAEIAPAIAFLASDEASYITGVVLPVDGGLAM